MDTLTALAALQKAGFTLAISGGGFTFYERAIGPFGVQVEHDALADQLSMRIAPTTTPPSRFRPWSIPLATPEAVLEEARNFIRVFESSACVGGD